MSILESVSDKCREETIKALQENLDTRDKRYMFLRLFFKEHLSRINIEGSPHETAWNIFEAFRKQHSLYQLIKCLNTHLDCKITYEKGKGD